MTSHLQTVFGTAIENAQGVTAAVAVLGKLNHKFYFRLFDEYKKQPEYFESLVYVSIDVLDECKDRKAMQQDMSVVSAPNCFLLIMMHLLLLQVSRLSLPRRRIPDIR